MTTRPVQLWNLTAGSVIGELGAEQLERLKALLTEESSEDTSFFIDPDTLDYLRASDADLADRFAPLLGDRTELEIGWSPTPRPGAGRAHGRLLQLDSGAPCVGYRVAALDEDIVADDPLGWTYSDAEGRFDIHFDPADFREPIDVEGDPEVELRVSDRDGEELGEVGLIQAMDADFGDVFVGGPSGLVAPALDPAAAAICPSCGATYEAGVARCSDCDRELRALTRR
jgi:hypothetical protein